MLGSRAQNQASSGEIMEGLHTLMKKGRQHAELGEKKKERGVQKESGGGNVFLYKGGTCEAAGGQ